MSLFKDFTIFRKFGPYFLSGEVELQWSELSSRLPLLDTRPGESLFDFAAWKCCHCEVNRKITRK